MKGWIVDALGKRPRLANLVLQMHPRTHASMASVDRDGRPLSESTAAMLMATHCGRVDLAKSLIELAGADPGAQDFAVFWLAAVRGYDPKHVDFFNWLAARFEPSKSCIDGCIRCVDGSLEKVRFSGWPRIEPSLAAVEAVRRRQMQRAANDEAAAIDQTISTEASRATNPRRCAL